MRIKLSILAIIICVSLLVLFSIWQYCNNNIRTNIRTAFINCNNYYFDEELDTIKSPQTYGIKFDQYYHLDSFYIYNTEGDVLIRQGTPFSRIDGLSMQDINAYNYPYFSPFNLNLGYEDGLIIATIESMLGYKQHFFEIENVGLDYFFNLSKEYKEKVYVPALFAFFNGELYLRPHSNIKGGYALTDKRHSIVRSLTLNNIGRIDQVFLYNNASFSFRGNDSIEYIHGNRFYVNMEQYLSKYYDYLGHSYETSRIAETHLDKALYQLTHLTFDVLLIKKKQHIIKNHTSRLEKVRYTFSYLLSSFGGIIFLLLLILFFLCLYYNEKGYILFISRNNDSWFPSIQFKKTSL